MEGQVAPQDTKTRAQDRLDEILLNPPTPEKRVALVAEDNHLQRRVLVSYLRKWGYKVLESANGQEALEMCIEHDPELVVSDWEMPGITGPELCAALRNRMGEGVSYSYVILLTSKQEKDIVATGLDAGADDFLMKPINPPELKARISAGARICDMQRELSDKADEIAETLQKLQLAYDTIDRDLARARTIQNSLVPEFHRQVGKSRVSLLLEPCGHVGGDLVGTFSPNDLELAFYNIDVSGHGITSAMMTSRLAGYLSSTYVEQNIGVDAQKPEGEQLIDPVRVAHVINDRLNALESISEYCTLAYARVNLKTGRARFVQAGHPHPLVIRANGTARYVGNGGMPLGLLSNASFDQNEIFLAPGDRLLLYSDGFTEACDPKGNMLEGAGFLSIVEECQHINSGTKFLRVLYEKLTELLPDDQAAPDDISAALFEFQPIAG